jgi:hypothetical protein
MSHNVSLEVFLSDLDAIEAACAEITKERGYKVTLKRNQKTYRSWAAERAKEGSTALTAGDYPFPEGFTEWDLLHCDHAIEVEGASYDVGLIKKGKGWKILFDFYCNDRLVEAMGCELDYDKVKRQQVLKKGVCGFAQKYSLAKVKLEAERTLKVVGLVKQIKHESGVVELQIPCR